MNRGGKREGAGRKKMPDARQALNCRISAESMEYLMGECSKFGLPIGRVLDNIIADRRFRESI